jgi:hypothetical protein
MADRAASANTPDSVLGLVGNGLRQDGGIKRVSSHLYFDYYRSADVLCFDAPAEVLEREQYVAISIAVCQKGPSAQSEGLEPGNRERIQDLGTSDALSPLVSSAHIGRKREI